MKPIIQYHPALKDVLSYITFFLPFSRRVPQQDPEAVRVPAAHRPLVLHLRLREGQVPRDEERVRLAPSQARPGLRVGQERLALHGDGQEPAGRPGHAGPGGRVPRPPLLRAARHRRRGLRHHDAQAHPVRRGGGQAPGPDHQPVELADQARVWHVHWRHGGLACACGLFDLDQGVVCDQLYDTKGM